MLSSLLKKEGFFQGPLMHSCESEGFFDFICFFVDLGVPVVSLVLSGCVVVHYMCKGAEV